MAMTRDHGLVLTYLKLKVCFRSSGTSHCIIRCRRKARVQSSGSEMLPVYRSQCWACPAALSPRELTVLEATRRTPHSLGSAGE